MDEITPKTSGPQHHSYRPSIALLILIGVIGGGVMYFGIMAWYFTRVDPITMPIRLEHGVFKSSVSDTSR